MKRFYTFFVICLALICWFDVADAQTVRMPDANLAAVVRDALGLDPNAPITGQALRGLKKLDASVWTVEEVTGQYEAITDITGLEHATGLTELWLEHNNIQNIQPLARLTRLEFLYIIGNEINDIRPLAKLTQLTRLSINVREIRDLSRQIELTQLERLYLSGWFNESSNQINDLYLLANSTQLTALGVFNAEVNDIKFLEGLTRLTSLNLWGNRVSDLKPLTGLTQLTWLSLGDNRILDVTPLAGLTNLESLLLKGNPIQNASVLANLPNLHYVDFNIPPIISIRRDDSSQEVPSVGQTLKYRVQIRSAWNVTGLNLSYIIPHQLTSVKRVAWFDGIDHNSSNNKTGTLKASGLETGNSIRDVAILTLNATAAGTGELRVEGKVTTTSGTDNVNTKYPLTIFPADDSQPPEEATQVVPIPDTTLLGAGPKIEGPWLWMVVPTARKSVLEVAASGKDYLATASAGAVTEQQIAMNGATVGERVKNRVWTLGKLAPTGGNNITDMVNAIGLKKGSIDYHVAYGAITLDSPRRQNTQMYVGSDDSVKVWLNGVLVYNKLADRAASNYQERFPVTLKKGKNILFVAVYNGIGWWSGFFGFKNNAVYSVVPVDPGVIPDPILAIVVRDTLGLAPGKSITKQALKKLTTLEASSYNIEELTGQEGTIADLTGLEHATKLESLSLENNQIQNIAPLTKLTQLEYLWIQNNPIKDLKPLANLKQLKYLFVSVNKIGTLRKYVDLTQLEALGIYGSGKSIQGLNLLAKLQQLRSLSVVSGKVKNLGFLKGLKQLEDLSLDHNAISNLSPLAGLTQLTYLSLSDNKIGNLKPLAKLTQLTYLDLDDNKIRNVTPLAKLTKLQILYLANNQIRNVTPLAKLTNLEMLWLKGNPIQDLSPLRRLTNLEYVDVEVPGQVAAAPATVAVPNQTALLANYPNPFNPETWIPYHLTAPADVTLTIYAVDGKVVRRLDLGHQAAGFYQNRSRAAYWDGRNTVGERVASGVYFYTLTAGDFSATQKMLIRK